MSVPATLLELRRCAGRLLYAEGHGLQRVAPPAANAPGLTRCMHPSVVTDRHGAGWCQACAKDPAVLQAYGPFERIAS